MLVRKVSSKRLSQSCDSIDSTRLLQVVSGDAFKVAAIRVVNSPICLLNPWITCPTVTNEGHLDIFLYGWRNSLQNIVFLV